MFWSEDLESVVVPGLYRSFSDDALWDAMGREQEETVSNISWPNLAWPVLVKALPGRGAAACHDDKVQVMIRRPSTRSTLLLTFLGRSLLVLMRR